MQSRRIERSKAAGLVIDLQEKLLPSISAKERVVQNAVRLVKGCTALRIPALVTEQYKKGLGPTTAEMAAAIPDFAPIEKLAFSACGAVSVVDRLQKLGATDIVVCGIEAHVCVCQTTLDLLDRGLRVFVIADAIGSRTEENRTIGIERMRQAGAIIVSTEMILFELLGCAGTEEFKSVLALVK